ncbi:hypothetical protein OSB04_003410 [Centaurea solstitialis]|uniref:Zinc-finger domain-containing protein n=1 Tax=Centaurea solstitialis TaxID=347529 RepID=A0AA38TWK8_9ASTR|nr:hypothetical protein OSB04_003410 [Centaurea solstitialis]
MAAIRTSSPKTIQTIQNESTHLDLDLNLPSSSSSSTPKRTKSPGIRVVGSRIYDSKNGKTCHQCRQKTMDFSVSCTNQMENKKQCPLNLCQACLSNRYGEKAEEAAALGDWKCPRCRGICNCSFCMKKRGCGPTGILVHTAKKNGFASVSNLLKMDGSTVAKIVEGGKRKTSSASDKEIGDEPIRKKMKQEVDGESEDEKKTIEETSEDHNVDIQLPKGTELINLAGVDMPSEDVGHALQLLEFCEAFGEANFESDFNGYFCIYSVLELKKGESEILLSELTCGNERKRHEPSVVQFHTRLLSLLEEDSGRKYSRKSWVEDLKECISESQYLQKESLLECFNVQPNGYDDLNFSKKLRLLNFLCDEALGTVLSDFPLLKLRLWIEEQNVVEKKKAKEKLIANREREKNLKKKLQDEVAKAILARNGVPLSISEQKHLISKIKAETAQTLANSLEMREVPRESYVVRTEPLLLDRNGCKLWKLRGYSDKIGILLQDLCYEDATAPGERWFAYDDQQKALVGKYISSSRYVRSFSQKNRPDGTLFGCFQNPRSEILIIAKFASFVRLGYQEHNSLNHNGMLTKMFSVSVYRNIRE